MQSTQCIGCKHFIGGVNGMYCEAFTEEKGKTIPLEILTGEFDHKQPFKGDGGVRYESSGLIDELED